MKPGRGRGLVAALLTLAALALFVAGCGGDDNGGGSSSSSSSGSSSAAAAQPGKGKPPITIGTKDFTEEFVLGELYKQALEAKGYTVNLKRNIGPTEITDKALTSKQIDAYPEYTGITTAVVAKDDKLSPTKEDTAREAKAFAQKNNLKSVADLKNLPSFSLGARPEFKSRNTGLVGMRKQYGIENAKFKQLALGLQYQALDKGDVDSANVFSTDSQLASGKYTVLQDPKGVFGFQQVYFVIDKAKYDALGGQQFASVIDSVNKLLTNPAMQSMNAAVDLDKKDPAAVAGQFLKANGLTGGSGS